MTYKTFKSHLIFYKLMFKTIHLDLFLPMEGFCNIQYLQSVQMFGQDKAN